MITSSETILLGRGLEILKVPRQTWEGHLAAAPQHTQTMLRFMTPDHHRVRYFAVRELARRGKPIEPGTVSQDLGLPIDRTYQILDDLEKKLFFLVRNQAGAIYWAYPVTVEPTPHSLSFSTGERLYAAWAEDALAAPFVQGKLFKEPLSVEIQTQCAHCGSEMRMVLNSDMHYTGIERGAEPLMFSPQVDWDTFTDPTIIDAFWRNSVFFWSEEHAREYRAGGGQVDGIYLSLEQAAYSIPITQGALFAFK